MASDPKSKQLLVLFLTVFVDLIGFSIIFPLFPQMLQYYTLHEGEGGFGKLVAALARFAESSDNPKFATVVLFGGLLGSIYSLLQFLFAPLWGRLSDRVGRKPVLMMTISGILASYLLWIFSGSFWLLVLSRLLGGVMSGNISVATAAVADLTSSADRSKGMGMIGAAFGLGFILGPALGGAMFQLEQGLQVSARLNLIPGIQPFSLAAAAAAVLAAWNLVWVWRRFSEPLTDAARMPNSMHRTANPVRLFAAPDIPGVGLTNLTYFLFLLAFSGMEFTLTFLASDRFDYTPGKNAVMFVYVGLLIALVQGGIVRRVAPRFGERTVAAVGLVLVVPGLVVTGIGQNQPVFYLGLGLLAVGSALAMPTLTSLVSLFTPGDRQGEVLGVFRSLGALSRAVGPIIACSIYWQFGSEWPYLSGAIFMAIPIALLFRIKPTAW